MNHKRERMAGVDAAWLRMDSDVQRIVVCGMFQFGAALSLPELRGLVRERLLQHRRFSQRAVEPLLRLGRPHWRRVRVDLDHHVQQVTLPRPRSDLALARLTSELACTPLDRDRPLWQIHLIEGHPQGPVLLIRLHHAIGDGVSLVRFLLSLADDGADMDLRAVGLPALAWPPSLARRAWMVGLHVATLAKLLLLPGDRPTLFRGPLQRVKRLAWTRPLPVAALEQAGDWLSAKLNDVLLALAAGAVRRYLARSGQGAGELRALVPVFFHGRGDKGHLGNHFGLVFAPMLVGIEDTQDRIRAVHRRMDVLKASAEAAVAFEILALTGAVGGALEALTVDIFTRKASFMVTNIQGPPQPLHLGGKPITDLVVWAPVAGHVGTGLSLVSYAGQVRVGFLADAALVPDPEALARDFEAEADALLAAAALAKPGRTERVPPVRAPASTRSAPSAPARRPRPTRPVPHGASPA